MTRTDIPKGAYYALALVSCTQAISLLDRQILAILAPAIKVDLHIGDAEMGLLFGTVFALFYALFSLPLGRLADGWTRTKLLALCLVFWSGATALGGLASGFATLALSRLGVGIGEAATQPAGTSLVYDYWPKHRRGFVMAVSASAIALGIGGSLVLGGVAAGWWDGLWGLSPSKSAAAPFALRGWQFALLVASAPGVVLAAFLWFLREPERGAMDGIPTPHDPAPFRASAQVLGSVLPGFNWLNLRRFRAAPAIWRDNLLWFIGIVAAMIALVAFTTHAAPRPPLAFGAVHLNPHALQWGVIGFGLFVLVNFMQNMKITDAQAHRVITGSPTVMMVMAVGALQGMINYGMMAFNPTFIMKQYGQSMGTAALQFGLLSASMGIIGPLIWGPLSDRLNARFPGTGRTYIALFAMTVSPIMSFWVYSAPHATVGPWYVPDFNNFYWRFVPYSLILTGWMPPLYAIMYDQVLPRMRGITTSAYLLLSTIIGLGIGPYMVGTLSEAIGDLKTAILSVNAAAIPIVILLIIVARRAERDEAGLLDRANGEIFGQSNLI